MKNLKALFLAAIIAAPGWLAPVLGATAQTITWTGTGDEILALGTPYPLGATASSGLRVTLRVIHGPAVITDGMITVSAPGTVWVTAEQAGDETFAPATRSRSFNVRAAVLTPVAVYRGQGALSVRVVGNYAYVLTYYGLQVIDVSDPLEPVLLGEYNGDGQAYNMDVIGRYAYLAVGPGGLVVIDVSDPANPVRVGSYDTSGFAIGLQVVGNTVYVADRPGGLQVIDVTDPSSPTRIGGYKTVYANDVQVIGNYGYVADGISDTGSRLQVIDVSDPANPIRIGECNTGSVTYGLQVVGNYAYVPDATAFGASLQIIDVSNPANPVRVGGLNTTGQAISVNVLGDYAYVAGVGAGVQVIDVTNPTRPMLVGGDHTSGFAIDLQVVGSYAYVADSGVGLKIFTIRLAYPNTVTWTGTASDSLTLHTPYPLAATASSGFPVTVRVESGPAAIVDGMITVTGPGTVWVTAEQAGDENYIPGSVTRAFNLRQAAVSLVGEYSDSAPIYDLAVNGGFLYAASAEGLRVFDVTDPALLRLVGQYPFHTDTAKILVVGNRGYLGSPGLFEVLDLTDPTKPALLGSIPVDDGSGNGSTPKAIEMVGHLVYDLRDTQLLTIDVSNPAAPAVLNAYRGESFSSFHVVGDLMYLTRSGWANNLFILDISKPPAPRQLANYNINALQWAGGVRAAGPFVYVLGYDQDQGRDQLVILQGDPMNLVVVGAIPVHLTARGVNATGLDVRGDYIFVSGRFASGMEGFLSPGGVVVFDATNPARIVRVGGYSDSTFASAFKALVVGEIAYLGGDIGNGSAPLKALRTTLVDPYEPRLETSQPNLASQFSVLSAPAIPGWDIQTSLSLAPDSRWHDNFFQLQLFEESDGIQRFRIPFRYSEQFFMRMRKADF